MDPEMSEDVCISYEKKDIPACYVSLPEANHELNDQLEVQQRLTRLGSQYINISHDEWEEKTGTWVASHTFEAWLPGKCARGGTAVRAGF